MSKENAILTVVRAICVIVSVTNHGVKSDTSTTLYAAPFTFGVQSAAVWGHARTFAFHVE